jgi:hypothetical protein
MTDFAIPVIFVNKRDNFDVHCTIYIPDTFEENLQEHLHVLQTRTKLRLSQGLEEEAVRNNIAKIDERNVVPIGNEQSVTIGPSVLQIGADQTVSIIHTPDIDEDDRRFLQLFLNLLVKSLLPKEGIYRANIMLLKTDSSTDSQRLRIEVHYNMDGYPDINIVLRPNEGGAGKALQKNAIQRVDLQIQTHEEYHVSSRSVWQDMKSLYSLPIHDSRGYILGVLNVDSNQELYSTRFYKDTDYDLSMRLASDVIGKYLERKK